MRRGYRKPRGTPTVERAKDQGEHKTERRLVTSSPKRGLDVGCDADEGNNNETTLKAASPIHDEGAKQIKSRVGSPYQLEISKVRAGEIETTTEVVGNAVVPADVCLLICCN
jgi:hypothetical protein